MKHGGDITVSQCGGGFDGYGGGSGGDNGHGGNIIVMVAAGFVVFSGSASRMQSWKRWG